MQTTSPIVSLQLPQPVMLRAKQSVWEHYKKKDTLAKERINEYSPM